MGKKKRRDDAEAARRIYCYYCDRNFDDEKALILHQKARHFKCQLCQRKLNTASGMVVHAMQVHKEKLAAVPNAKPGRDSVDVEIYGMQGVPGEPGVEDPAKKPRLDGGGLPMGGLPIGFPGARVPPPMAAAPHLQGPPAMMGMRPLPPPRGPPPPRGFAPMPGPPGFFPPRPMPGAVPGVPPPMWGAIPGVPGVPRPVGAVPVPPVAPGSIVPPAAMAFVNPTGMPPAAGVPLVGAVPHQGLAPAANGSSEQATDPGLIYSDATISMVRLLRPTNNTPVTMRDC